MSRSFIKIYLFGFDLLLLIVPGIFPTLPGRDFFLKLFYFILFRGGGVSQCLLAFS